MDPNLFHLDWDRTAEVLATVVVLSLVVERALSVPFESSWYIDRFQKEKQTRLKELVSVAVASVICILWEFDAVSMIVLAERTNWFGCLVTGGVIAGGSKGSIRIFREWLGIKSEARKEYEKQKDAKAGETTPLTPDEVAALKALANKPSTRRKKPEEG